MKQLATTDEIAALLQLTKARVYAMAREGVFPIGVVVRFGRQIRFDQSSLEKWIENGGTKPGEISVHDSQDGGLS